MIFLMLFTFLKPSFLALTCSLDCYQLFIYADNHVPIEDSAFWQRGYQLRRKTTTDSQRSSNAGRVTSKPSTGNVEAVLASQRLPSGTLQEPGSPSYMPSSPEGKKMSSCR